MNFETFKNSSKKLGVTTLGVLGIAFGVLQSVEAKDLGFRYEGNACVDKNGKKGWNPGYFGQCGDLRGVTVAGVNFDEADFSGAQLDGSDFQNSTFSGAKFVGTSVVGTNLSGATLTNAMIIGANFTKAILVNTHFAGAEIHKSDFSGSDLSGQLFSTMNLTGNSFVGTSFLNAKLDGADLSNCDLTAAKFTKVNLQGAKIEKAKLNRVNFAGADLTGASLKGSTGPSANFSYAIMRQSQLDGASLLSANLQGAKLDQASLKKTDLRSANLRQAVLKEAQIEGGNFTGAIITKSTVLPISHDEAIGLGMTIDAKVSLLIIHDNNQTMFELLTALTKLGVSYALQSTTANFKADVDLGDYAAVLHFNVADYQTEMPDAGQDALVRFVQDGGVFITTNSTNYGFSQNKFKKMNELMLFKWGSNKDGALTLTPKVSHPVLSEITESFVTNERNAPVATLIDFASNKSTVLMTDQGNAPRLAVRDIGQGHVVAFNLCYPGRVECQLTPGFQKIVANSAKWTSGRKLKAITKR